MAKYAGSGHQDPSTCLEGTRITALEEINEWKRKTVQEDKADMMWLTGSAGSGKTAIAQTVYERFKTEGLLVVQTAFFRSTGCTNPKFLPLSIAYQLAEANFSLGAFIEAVLQTSPAVVDAPVDVQLRRLVLGPISEAASLLPIVYVILDGLDECGVEDQQIEILQLIQAIITEQHLPIRFLIASRPESWIRTTLSSPSAPPLLTVILNRDEEADSDIRLYYETEFTKMRNDPRHVHSMPSVPSPWPSTDNIEQLVEWASGQFIYAKTVIGFVGEPGHSPIRRLETVLQPNSESTKSQFPLDRLDALYIQILSCVVDWDLTSNVLGALSIHEAFMEVREALSIIEVLLGQNPGDAYLALRSLHPLVFVPSDLTSERERIPTEEYEGKLFDVSQYPHFFHKSFIDFFHDSKRAGEYFIDEATSNAMMAIGSLKVLQSVNMKPSTRLFSFTWLYAHKSWEFHCIRSGSKENHKLLEELDRFSFISWHFISPSFRGQWERLGILRRLEIWNDDGLEAIRKIDETLKTFNQGVEPGHGIYYAYDMWDWFKCRTKFERFLGKSQNDTKFREFPKLRFKLWILHKLADERGHI
ncbi:hypothetical protein CPB83DRAFT_899820 [Crepidotus variabilis]|uniref:NACHT domain-containing protein n=1 Tax=Crepidotus variabilis TaxID=179855 RepID=A0A9P6E4E5_9AGAR|nr:hypothetical protein CPB83DRAFT_899820 [Crepidotus variabilis]